MSTPFSEDSGAGRVDPARYRSTLNLSSVPQIRGPHLKKGDKVTLVWGTGTTWVVTDVDDDGNGTLEPWDP